MRATTMGPDLDGASKHKMRVKRICPGEYEVSHREYVVSISRFEHLDYNSGQWVVQAQWDRYLYSDPIIYLKDAKRTAIKMIEDAVIDAA